MHIGKSLLTFLSVAMIISNAQIAYVARLPMPRVLGTSPLTAICRDGSGRQIKIYRVRLIGVRGSDETLKVNIGQYTERLSLNEIRQLRFLTSQINADGFMKATISRTGDTEEILAMVQVLSNRTVVRLEGFTSSGRVISMELWQCQTIEFSSTSEIHSDP